MPSKIGRELAALDDLYAEWFEERILVTNYNDAKNVDGHDQWDDPNEKQPTADSPIEHSGQVDPISAIVNAEPWARDIDADVVIFVKDDVAISDGDELNLPYQSDVEIPARNERYRVTKTTNEGNGLLLCFATSLPYRGDSS